MTYGGSFGFSEGLRLFEKFFSLSNFVQSEGPHQTLRAYAPQGKDEVLRSLALPQGKDEVLRLRLRMTPTMSP